MPSVARWKPRYRSDPRARLDRSRLPRRARSRASGYSGTVRSDVEPRFPGLRFIACLKAARDFGLDQRTLNAIALEVDPRRPDLDRLAGDLAGALRGRTWARPDAL
jgi:hypothetical protein